MNQDQKICLWLGTTVLDLLLIPALITCIRFYSFLHILIIAIFFVMINTGVIFAMLGTKKPKQKE